MTNVSKQMTKTSMRHRLKKNNITKTGSLSILVITTKAEEVRKRLLSASKKNFNTSNTKVIQNQTQQITRKRNPEYT